jgi:hypothetical protein
MSQLSADQEMIRLAVRYVRGGLDSQSYSRMLRIARRYGHDMEDVIEVAWELSEEVA